MKGLILSISILALSALATPTALAQPKSTYKLDIFPLECSYDTIALGNTIAKQLTPDNCLPAGPDIIPDEQTPATPSDHGFEEPSDSPAFPSAPLPTSPLSPPPHAPAPVVPTAPPRYVPNDHTSATNKHPRTLKTVEVVAIIGFATLATTGIIFLARSKKRDDT